MINKKNFITVARYLLAILFIYASVYKLFNLSVFRAQLFESPLLPTELIPFIAVGVPFFELGLAVSLLFLHKFEYVSLSISFALMFFFSVYLIMLYTLYDKPPCACGGILAGMDYPVHIVFNIAFTVLSFLSVTFYDKD